MENTSLTKSYFLGISLLIGLTSLGFFIYKGLKTFSDKDRIVTVKGLAEINIKATSASTSLNFSFSGDNLQEVIKRAEAKKNSIISYLTTIGYDKKSIYANNMDIVDNESYYITEWQNGKQVKIKIDRYKINQSLNLDSKDIESTET